MDNRLLTIVALLGCAFAATGLSPDLPQRATVGGKTPSVRLGRVIAENAAPVLAIAARR